ncbi:MAG TPA: hypothetical protein VJU81_06785 [Methylomirabilota bacterium]|nr:hypothetical protein [Methylomirabilota bacterium]
MRLVGAGLLVYATMLALVALLSRWRVFDRAPAWLVGFGIALFGLGASVLVMWLLNSRGSSPWGRRTAAEHLAELERLGLLESEPITDDPDMIQPRKFPCTEFTVRRHRTERYAIDILCGGRALEPEAVGPPFSKKAWAAKQVPEDGEIIASAGYDELKRTHAAGPGP